MPEDFDAIVRRVLKREDVREQEQRQKEAQEASRGAAMMDEIFVGIDSSSDFERLLVSVDRAANGSDIIVTQFETARVCTIKQRGADLDFHWDGETVVEGFASLESAVDALIIRCRKKYRREIDGSGRPRQPGVYAHKG